MQKSIDLVVCGAHLSGLALNHQLVERGGILVEVTYSAACYRMYAIAGTPLRPAMIRVSQEGVSLPVEVWRLTAEAFGDFVSQIPAPLGIGKVLLLDNRAVSGFIAEAISMENAQDITSYGGWRNYLASLAT